MTACRHWSHMGFWHFVERPVGKYDDIKQPHLPPKIRLLVPLIAPNKGTTNHGFLNYAEAFPPLLVMRLINQLQCGS
jgi:hypothetical protein